MSQECTDLYLKQGQHQLEKCTDQYLAPKEQPEDLYVLFWNSYLTWSRTRTRGIKGMGKKQRGNCQDPKR
ncbi:agnoprotein [Sea otter polyomavirus 1]|uniref:Agnoprotein n=1 Tax=Sea otter polyomavirus 1 TaxID=1552409 RepID=A0A097A5I2_9POLY|nr:agnoprotein [Sea otter polyomavirus 1]AIS40923.1 agnoprotein [Sea otter polyomavirus 1]